jgi:response regulator RpfG family c-di-GMP phosphodiesterase
VKILVVDNDEGLRDYLAMIIETGFECDLMEAGSATEAIEILKSNPETRLVISEIELPEGGAQAVYDHTSKESPPIPFICLTSKPNDDVTVVMITNSYEYNGYSPKPFKDADLFPLVEHALNAPFKKPVKKASKENEENPAPSLRSGDDWDCGQKKKQQQEVEGDADWSIEPKKKKQGEAGEADWGIAGKKKHQGEEGDADWGIAGKKKPQGEEGDADWGIDGKKKAQGEEGEADWGIDGKKGPQAEGDADWGIDGKKGPQGEGDADWGIDGKKGPQGDVDLESEPKKEKVQYRDPSKIVKKADDEEEVEDDRFVKVKIKRFLNFNSLPCDVFLRLGPTKFVKIVEKNDLYESDLIAKYVSRKVKNLHIMRNEYEDFNKAFSNLIMSSLKSKNLTAEQRAVGELVAYTHILDQAKKVGISEFVAEQARQTVENSIAQMKETSALGSILDSIMRGQDFISEHSLFLTYICQSICSKTSWGSQATYQKLSMAALLHDATLSKPELAHIEHKDTELFKALSKEDQKHVLGHPDESASLAASGGNLYADIENIIVQHHEQPDGTGFPRGLSPLRISPLSCIFIIAQDYMHTVIKPDVTDEEIRAAIEKIKEKYPRGNFKKPLQGFIAAFDKSVK